MGRLKTYYSALFLLLFFAASCGADKNTDADSDQDCEYARDPLVHLGSSPCLTFFEGKYYHCQSSYVKVSMRCAEKINDLYTTLEQTIFYSGNDHQISAPRLYHLDDAWYIYYSSDDGDLSVRNIHVLRNPAHSPLEGIWEHKAVLKTGIVKSVHPSIFNQDGQLYLFFSGSTQKDDAKIWDIYCCKMSNPWTISSKASMILSAQLEWECQWAIGDIEQDITPEREVEAPICIYSQDKSKALLYYAASASLSQYYCEGMAFSDASDDLTKAESWTKLPNPVFIQEPDSDLHGTGHISFVDGPDDEEKYFVYHAYNGHPVVNRSNRCPRIQKWTWDENGIPALGKPCSGKTPVPSWEKKYQKAE